MPSFVVFSKASLCVLSKEWEASTPGPINPTFISYPALSAAENNMTAICRATATTENESFTDIGDASPQSVNSNIVPHIIRMASTRAKARVLRDLTNVGMTAIEELALDDNIIEDKNINTYAEEEPPTKRQIDTIKKLSEELNMPVNYDQLTKKSAGNLISKMINEVKK